ncbi:MAG: L-histidine N(alpha)-methyltransferase [Burkholderiaceae bacterium]
MNYPERLQQLPLLNESTSRAPAFRQLYREDAAAIRAELLEGLMAQKAAVAPKFFYDALGSRLFEAITELPEYYPTRVEAQIFGQRKNDIARALGKRVTLIDLGAGNCEKAAKLFPSVQPVQYVAVDISVDFLHQALDALQRQFPATDMLGVGMDFSASLQLPRDVRTDKRVFFYPGSSIGNFEPAVARALLTQVATQAGQGGALLIGIDLVKPLDVLVPAYDDALGVTAAFNLNMLLHLNRLIDTNFALQDWQHVALFNVQENRVEMHLQARRALTVQWPGGARAFAEGERIHTECSYKYTPDSARVLLEDGGFTVTQFWTDAQQQFAVVLAHVK